MIKKIILVTAVFIVLTSCVIKDLDPGEEAAYVSQLCSSIATSSNKSTMHDPLPL